MNDFSNEHAAAATAFDAPADAGECAEQYTRALRAACAQLGAETDDADQILQNQSLRLHGVDFALRLNEATQHLEFFGDCGLPSAHQEAEVHRQLLEDALSNDIPGLCFGVHAVSRHVVAKGSLYLPAADDEGWTCAALLVAAVARVQAVRQGFALSPGSQDAPQP
ncbi:MAG TPA: hypothetical protein VLJ86_00530 [Ramlibacter sp.]|nr:hypothetical protein [Ramlibacter sp.]